MRFFSWRGVVSSLFGFLSFSWLWSTVRMVEHYSNCENGHPEVEHSVRNPKAFQQALNSVFHDFENRLHIWVKIRRLCWIIISVQAKTCPTCSVFIQKQLSISWAMGRINQVGQPEENPWKFCKILRVWQFRPGLTNVRRVYIKQNGKVSRVIVPNLSNFRKASPELFKFKMWLLQKNPSK
jgi:hypothetical protein